MPLFIQMSCLQPDWDLIFEDTDTGFRSSSLSKIRDARAKKGMAKHGWAYKIRRWTDDDGKHTYAYYEDEDGNRMLQEFWDMKQCVVFRLPKNVTPLKTEGFFLFHKMIQSQEQYIL